MRWTADTGTRSETAWQVSIAAGAKRRRVERSALFDAVEERLCKPGRAWPVIGHYGPGAPDWAPPGKRMREMNWRLAGYRNALDANQNDQALMTWVEEEWTSDIMAREHGVAQRGLASALCTLMSAAVPEIRQVRPHIGTHASSLDVTLTGGEEIRWQGLTPAIHRRAALFGDIGRRAMMLNSGQWSDAAQRSSGTILIDAIEDTGGEQADDPSTRTILPEDPIRHRTGRRGSGPHRPEVAHHRGGGHGPRGETARHRTIAMRVPHHSAAWVRGAVVFAGAWLVFWVQPLAVRTVLPTLGGSPAVWNTAMVFFQCALLAGYALAHGLVQRAQPKLQLIVLAGLWTGVAVTAPVGSARVLGSSPGAMPPTLWLLGTLGGALGIAFIASACLTPLVQAWLAQERSGAQSRDPYFLYATSNIGSAAALLAYPLILEPWIGLRHQAWAWSAAALCVAPAVVVLWDRTGRGTKLGASSAEALTSAAPSAMPIARIVALAALPSALLLGLTRYLTTDVAAVPMLWIMPLALYLGTFAHAFAARPAIGHRAITAMTTPALIGVAILYPFTKTVLALAALHLVVFVIASAYCHGTMARLRPATNELTKFYLLVATGGVIGGSLIALVAPLVFNDVYEYPIALACVAMLLPATVRRLTRRERIVLATALALTLAGLISIHGINATHGAMAQLRASATVMTAIGGPMALFALRGYRWRLTAALAIVMLLPGAVTQYHENEIARERTFYGVYRVSEQNGVRNLYHGTTLHGQQWIRDDGAIESRTTYYGIGTPYDELFRALKRTNATLSVALAGLGTGSLACHTRPGDTVHIYEIDPMVVTLARRHFAALERCAADAVIVTGDARLALEGEEETFDLIALDTFSSDAIPVHMLTHEAMSTYLKVLRPGGIIAVHVSNRHLNLEPVLAGLARQNALAGRIKRHRVNDARQGRQRSKSSDVVVLAKTEQTLRDLDLDADWTGLKGSSSVRVWTDDYTSIAPLVKWW